VENGSVKKASQDLDGMSVDLDAPQRYIPTLTRQWKRNSEDTESHRQIRSSRSLDRNLLEGVSTMIDAETLNLQHAEKVQERNPQLSAGDKTKRKKEKKRRMKKMKAEKAKMKQADKETKAVMEALGESKTMGPDGGEQDAAIREDSIVETPRKKRKLDKEVSQDNSEIRKVEHEQGAGEGNAQETPKSTPKKKKRKIDDCTQSTPVQLNSILIPGINSYLTSIIEASPRVEVEDNAAKTTPKHRKRKHSQESPLILHTLLEHEPLLTLDRINFDPANNRANGNSERKKKKKGKVSKDSVGKTFLIPSGLLTPATKGEGALLQSILKGCISNGSNSNPTSEEASKTTPIGEAGYSEDETKETLWDKGLIMPPKPKANVSTSPFPIRPKKEISKEVRKETPILPPKRLFQTAARGPAILSKLARPKKVKAEPMTHSDDDEERRETKKHKVSGSKKSKTVKGEAETEQTFPQTIASIKKSTDSKIHELFSDDESEEKTDEDPLTQALDSIRRSSSKLQNLFSPVPDPSCTPSKNAKSKKRDSSVEVEKARGTSINPVLPLVFSDGDVNVAAEDWETTVGKLRSSAGGDDDSEAQESTSVT
jgi:hypothetical protein